MAEEPEDFELVFDDTNSTFSVDLVDDGRTGWAYLRDRSLDGDDRDPIISDVWLYNVAETPPTWQAAKAEHAGRKHLPMLNSAPFVRTDEPVIRLSEAEDVGVLFVTAAGQRTVEIRLDDVLYARLAPDHRVGWSRLAVRDNGCALALALDA